MTTGQLILILLLVLVAAVLVALILRRGSARREEQRVEAADLRSQADAVAPTVAGQRAFAEQAEQRADVARAEAEEKAREAARLEQEAAEQRRAAEAARQEHEAILRRADDVDPDVKESQYPPLPEDARPEPAPSEGVGDASSDGDAAATDGDDADQPMTRAERRRAREEAEARGEESGARGDEDDDRGDGAGSPGESTWASGPAAPIAGAAGAAAVGTAAWADHDEREGADEERSARIASAADYRDDVEGGEVGEPRRSEDVSTDHQAGTEKGMDQDQRSDATTGSPETADRDLTDTESPRDEWGDPRDGDGGRDAAGGGVEMVDDTDAYAATEPTLTEDQAPGVEPERVADDADRADAADGAEAQGADAADREPGAGERERATALATGQGAGPGDVEEEGTDAVVVTDIESYASTEPVLADGSLAGERDPSREDSAADGTHGERDGAADEPLGVEPAGDATPADEESQAAVTGERTDQRDWAADEGRMLDENRERGDRLAADRESLDDEAPADTTDEGGHGSSEAPVTTGRRVSEFHEIRDGGFGVGSAAPLEDGGQPMGHPIAAHRDSMTFRGPGDAGYEDSQPDVWFYDEGAAERAGFRRSEG